MTTSIVSKIGNIFVIYDSDSEVWFFSLPLRKYYNKSDSFLVLLRLFFFFFFCSPFVGLSIFVFLFRSSFFFVLSLFLFFLSFVSVLTIVCDFSLRIVHKLKYTQHTPSLNIQALVCAGLCFLFLSLYRSRSVC